jgi:hypothetical protein
MIGKNQSRSIDMDRRNFLGVPSGVGVAPVWNRLRATDTSPKSETDTEPPLVVDRFHAGSDYNDFIIGTSRAGKSHTAKMQRFKDKIELESSEEEQMVLVIGNSTDGKSFHAKQMSGAELPEKNQTPLDIQA